MLTDKPIVRYSLLISWETENEMMSPGHRNHLIDNVSHNNCPECRADCSRRFARTQPFEYGHVSKYLAYVRPRIEAIRNGSTEVNARIWQRGFMDAMHKRISSHIPNQNGRKHAPEYAKYHLATYGNDQHFLNAA